MPKSNGREVKDEEQYQALRRQGASKEKAARIANSSNAGKRGGESPRYEDMSRDEVYEKAKKVGVDGRSKMNKNELIRALRNR